MAELFYLPGGLLSFLSFKTKKLSCQPFAVFVFIDTDTLILALILVMPSIHSFIPETAHMGMHVLLNNNYSISYDYIVPI